MIVLEKNDIIPWKILIDTTKQNTMFNACVIPDLKAAILLMYNSLNAVGYVYNFSNHCYNVDGQDATSAR